ncbi:DUF3575 domain-containing protein [Flavobacterium sp. SUN052]|uniref:DUF3575 domain-containing protein n=1 Tax=Flavobacterium sp. SUN052 TaxID=3002441 RepID=UPI00237DEB33|nr:DUF3575 domain-containing protein [Flavobacterium sp. SUN052]MEC4004215.1 DUF3575 domain-containing protein [Flavobacterium sp. SUN052]
MKRTVVLLCFIFFQLAYSQEKATVDFKQNEFKGNALFLIIGQPEITYERILEKESGIGVSVNFAIDKAFETKFSLTPFYRFYFGKKPAAGLFVEGFAMLNSLKIEDETAVYYNYSTGATTYMFYKGDSYIDFALGFGVGAKWISKRGVILEVNGGIGRNLLNSEKNDYFGHTFVGRGGLTVGYRF